MEGVRDEGALDAGQERIVRRLEGDLKKRMAEVKPKRYAHSLSVARTAQDMAVEYGADPFQARVAGILHDWDKVVPTSELVSRARDMGIDMGVDLELVAPLLHGLTAARELPSRYPELPQAVWRAISLHTVGSATMGALDMVLFVADGIEPLRKGSAGIEHVRDMVRRHAPLHEVYAESFCGGVVYVVQTRRYLYPGTIDIYNRLVLGRTGA
jgi:predicted HD superfamily hydrolase involved in NAD metabolism